MRRIEPIEPEMQRCVPYRLMAVTVVGRALAKGGCAPGSKSLQCLFAVGEGKYGSFWMSLS